MPLPVLPHPRRSSFLHVFISSHFASFNRQYNMKGRLLDLKNKCMRIVTSCSPSCSSFFLFTRSLWCCVASESPSNYPSSLLFFLSLYLFTSSLAPPFVFTFFLFIACILHLLLPFLTFPPLVFLSASLPLLNFLPPPHSRNVYWFHTSLFHTSSYTSFLFSLTILPLVFLTVPSPFT